MERGGAVLTGASVVPAGKIITAGSARRRTGLRKGCDCCPEGLNRWCRLPGDERGGRSLHDAFLRYDSGDAAGAYALCTALDPEGTDPALSALAAQCLLSMGRLEEAESHFRDLINRFPNASHAHGALARILATI